MLHLDSLQKEHIDKYHTYFVLCKSKVYIVCSLLVEPFWNSVYDIYIYPLCVNSCRDIYVCSILLFYTVGTLQEKRERTTRSKIEGGKKSNQWQAVATRNNPRRGPGVSGPSSSSYLYNKILTGRGGQQVWGYDTFCTVLDQKGLFDRWRGRRFFFFRPVIVKYDIQEE